MTTWPREMAHESQKYSSKINKPRVLDGCQQQQQKTFWQTVNSGWMCTRMVRATDPLGWTQTLIIRERSFFPPSYCIWRASCLGWVRLVNERAVLPTGYSQISQTVQRITGRISVVCQTAFETGRIWAFCPGLYCEIAAVSNRESLWHSQYWWGMQLICELIWSTVSIKNTHESLRGT